MASPRASRGPLPLLLLLLLPLPASGTRGQPAPAPSAPSGAPLAGAGLVRPAEPGPERELHPPPRGESRGPAPPGPSQTATRRGPSGRAPRGRSAAVERNHWPESNTEPHLENITFYQGQVNFSTVTSKEPVMGRVPRKSLPSSNAPENFTLLAETANAGGRYRSGSRTDFTSAPLEGSPEIATALGSQHSTSASGTAKDNFTVFKSPSVSHTKGPHDATTFPDGVPRMPQSVPVSLRPRNETAGFLEYSKIAMTSASVHFAPSAEEVRRDSRVTENLGDEELIEPSTENGFGLTSSEMSRGLWQSDSPTLGGHQLASSSDANNGSSISQMQVVSSWMPSTEGGKSSAHWFWTNGGSLVNVTRNSTSSPEAVNSSVVIQFSDSSPQPAGSTLGERHYPERSTENALFTSSSDSLDSSVSRGERSTLEDSTDLGGPSDAQEKASSSHPHSPHTSATFTGSGERTLRSLTSGSATLGDIGSSASVLGETESATWHLNVTEDTALVSVSGAVSSALGVTGISYGQVSGTDNKQRTSSDLADHTYVSSTFTKGERALLSITDNSSSSDIRESSTSYIKIANSSHAEDSSSSHTQTEGSNASSYAGEYTQSSTESLLMRTPNSPSYTSTINVPNTLVLLNVDTESVDNSSSPSGPPLALPSVSQSHQLSSSTLLSTKASAPLLKSTSDASLSSSLSPLTVSAMASTPVLSTFVPSSVSQTTLTHPSSTPILPSARETSGTSVRTWTVTSPMEVLHSSQTANPKNQSDQEETIAESKSPNFVSSTTATTEAVTVGSPSGVPLLPGLTESSTQQTLPATSTSLAQTSPALRATTQPTSFPPVTTVSLPSSTAALMGDDATVIQTTARKQALPTTPEVLVPQITTQGTVTTKRTQVHVDTTTRLIPLTIVSTSEGELATRVGIMEEHSSASHFSRASPPQATDVSTAPVLTTTFPAQGSTQSSTTLPDPASANSCATNPCLHAGTCIADTTSRGYRCVCSPSWQGDECSVDVNECLSNPCPPLAMCNNTQGSFTCRCPVGYQLDKGVCNLVRTFVTEFKLKKTFLNTTVEEHSDLHEVENEITKTLNACFSTLPGYARSTVHVSGESSMLVVSLHTTFSLASNVTLFDLADSIQRCVNSCRSSAEVCQLLGSQRRVFRAGSLCKRKSPECDRETSICTDLDGVALCQCKVGYFQFNKMDHSCRACEDGYRLENETCMSCPFGLGGLNCGNPYQLITVVIAAAGGGLLLILGIALIVTCCRKNKNDISKLIFKSGDFQMSPYAEYPKNPRSQEWGREAIEMHENGSTKNLLQMTDVYYSPTGVRNPELERNGLYPAYTGLPGSRHSCIFPGQYNPSFISDESRRRDYF
ncbi:protein HEG homolog 1 [Rhynchocyon petersi]